MGEEPDLAGPPTEDMRLFDPNLLAKDGKSESGLMSKV